MIRDSALWGEFGTIAVGDTRRRLSFFVMVLAWSRQMYVEFTLSQTMEQFLAAHVNAFNVLGVPKKVMVDNLRCAVLRHPRGEHAEFNPRYLDFARHYGFQIVACAVAKGNEKGRVERAIRYVREAFFAARTFTDLEDLNAQADAWCAGQAADRPCPEDLKLSVREAFAAEQPRLLGLPENPFPTDEVLTVKVGKTPYVRFDLNDYTIPHTHVMSLLTVRADPRRVRVTDGAQLLADHPRSYDRDQQVEDPAHVRTLVEHKRQARHHRGANQLGKAAPASLDLLARAAERGSNLGTLTAALLRLLDRYGAAALQVAIVDALQSGVPHPNAVRLALERRREARHDQPPLATCLPQHVKDKDAPVQPHRLDAYDALAEENNDEQS